MASPPKAAIYGLPPRDLVQAAVGAVQVSPLIPGSALLEELRGLESLVVHAPPGALERRYVLALCLQVLAPGGRLVALAAKDKGGSRLHKELEGFGCTVAEDARRHHRICAAPVPEALAGLEEAIAAGGPQVVPATGLWSQPGLFSWDRTDPGSALLAQALPPLAGRGADLGCGTGYLATAALAFPAVQRLDLVDVDRRAVEAARRNVEDDRAAFHWADATVEPVLGGLDFVVMNPPFHATGIEDRSLGQAFIRRAAQVLRPEGTLFCVANRHLPYEAVLSAAFKAVRVLKVAGGFKLFEAIR